MHKELSNLVGAQVHVVKLSNQFVSIVLYGGVKREKKYAELQIEADFQLKKNKEVSTIEPGNVKTLAPIIQLLHTKLTSISLTQNQTISLAFDNDYTLTAEPIEKYEAWNLFVDDLGQYGASGI